MNSSTRPRLFWVWIAALLAVAACAGHKVAPEHVDTEWHEDTVAQGPVHISLPREGKRDDRKSPILEVESSGSVVFAKVYGYPIYPEGEASQGILMLRRDNWPNMKKSQRTDDGGVVHGCRIAITRENANKFVPLSITCELPPPKGVGGAKRPVIGDLFAGAKAEQLLKDKSVEEVFLGQFHLKSDDFDAGSGLGYFNTTHGQLAFGFSKKRLIRFVYYFDPDVKGWQNPTLWVKP
jgi:hypothetical protein